MNTYRRTIIIVDNSVALTGALKAIVTAISSFKNNFEFVFVLPKHTTARTFIIDQNFTLYQLPFIEISKSPKNLFLYPFYLLYNGYRLRNIAKKHRATIIHMNDFYNLTGLMAKFWGAKIPVITHVRFLPQRFIPILGKFWRFINLRFANQIVCVSEAVKCFFPESNKLWLIPDPLPEKEKYSPKKVNTISQNDEVQLFYLSNYIRGKGQDHALLAFKDVYAVNKRLRLTFAGGDMGLRKNQIFRQELEDSTKRFGLQEVVRFEPFVQDIEKAIKAADILLNFSESESFSLTCLDALFYGTPLIATDSGGPAELFENNISGILVANKDVEAMKQAILDLAGNKEKQLEFSKNGRVFVRQKFSPENSYLKLKSLYERLLVN